MSPDHELSELQARVIADAAEVFDRVSAQIADTAPADDDVVASADPVGEQQLRAAGARLLDVFAGLVQDGVDAYLELAQSLVRTSAGAGAGLSLRGAAGERATTTVWLHSASQEPVREIELRLTDLQSPAGERIAAAAARFVPGSLRIAGGESASSILTLAIAPQAGAGTYFGHVLAAGLPAGALALTLVVEPRPT